MTTPAATPLDATDVFGITEPTMVSFPDDTKQIVFKIAPELITKIHRHIRDLGFTNDKLSKTPIPDALIVKDIKELLRTTNEDKLGSIHDRAAVLAYVALTERVAAQMGYWNSEMLDQQQGF